jgi:tetratricopeptide (TPR) repeat protein
MTVNNINDSIDTLLSDLKKSIKTKETVVFCGAGISFNSGLPLANDLVWYVLEKLGLSEEETETIINSNLPFEAFIETLRGNSEVKIIYNIFDLGKPNTNHILLAKLAKAKYIKTICTTNFDLLIEKAFESEGLIRKKDFHVFYKEDDLDNIDWDDNKVRLIKIHGSVEDKENMSITLQQVSHSVPSAKRMSVIERIFSKGTHKNVLILGYSCSDIFDISPQIENMRENHKNVIFIDHSEKEQVIKDIKYKKMKNPFKHFSGSKWVLYNTDKLVKELLDICESIDNYSFQETTPWKKCLDDWYLETEGQDIRLFKCNNASGIFFRIAAYENAVAYTKQGLSIARKIGNKQQEGKFLANLAGAYGSLGEVQKSIELFTQALNITKEVADKKGEGSCLRNLGVNYGILGEVQKSIEITWQALDIIREYGDKQEELICLLTLGSSYGGLGDYQEKREYYDQAIAFYDQALNIARNLGDKQNEGKGLGCLGYAYLRHGNVQRAIDYFEQALSIATQIGDKQCESDWLSHLGDAYGILGDYQKSIEYSEQALNIARETKDKMREGECLGSIGNAYLLLGNYEKAIEFSEQALVIIKPILGDEHTNVKLITGNINSIKSQQKL